MIVKEAYLKEEINNIKTFLEKFSLKLDDNVTKTFYIEEDDKIIGTISTTSPLTLNT